MIHFFCKTILLIVFPFLLYLLSISKYTKKYQYYKWITNIVEMEKQLKEWFYKKNESRHIIIIRAIKLVSDTKNNLITKG